MYGPCVFPESYVVVCALHLQLDCCDAFEWVVRDKFLPISSYGPRDVVHLFISAIFR